MNVSLKKLTDALVRLQSQINALSGGGGGSSGVQSVTAGAGIAVDNTDPANPVVSATGGATSAKAWRLLISASNGATTLQIRDIDYHAEPDGTDLCSGGTAFASSTYSSSYLPSFAFGTDSGSGPDVNQSWASATGVATGYVGYILPAASEVNEIAITALLTASLSQMPRDFIVQSSTDSTNGSNGTWKDEWAVVDQTGWTVGEIRTFTRP